MLGLGLRMRGARLPLPYVPLLGGGDPYGSYLLYESLAGNNNQSLDSRPAEKGGSWADAFVAGRGMVTTGTGRGRMEVAGQENGVRTVSNIAAVGTITLNMVEQKVTNDPAIFGIIFNYMNDTNYWFAGRFFNFWSLRSIVAGADTEHRGSPDPVVHNSARELKVVTNAAGTTVSFTVGGIVIGGSTYTDAARPLRAEQKLGVRTMPNTGEEHLADLLTMTAATN